MDILGPESLCFMKEKDAFFLSDWSKLFENGAADLLMSDAPITTTIPSLQGQKLTSQELAGEIKALALSVLKLNKIDFSKIESLRQVKGIDSGEFASEVERTLSKSFNEEKKGLQQLIEKMLTLESQNLPNLGDLRIEDAKSQAPINEESKQINDIEAQHPSRPVAQIQHEGQEAISSSKGSVITGKLSYISELISPLIEETVTRSSTMLAWCANITNKISIADFNTKQSYANFVGATVSDPGKI